MPKATKSVKPQRGLYLVALDYQTRDLLGSGRRHPQTSEPLYDGKGAVCWAAGAIVELDTAAAAWVNQQQPGTLEDYVEAADPDLDPEED